MLTAFWDHVWLVLELISVAVGISSGFMLFLPLFSLRIRRGKREAPVSGQENSRKNAAIAFAISIVVFLIGAFHEELFVTTPEQPEFSVSASYEIITFSLTDQNVTIHAYTSSEADYVTVAAVPLSGSALIETYYMRTYDKKNWTFPANFYIKGTYTVTVCAYDRNGNMSNDMFTVTYPFA